jgi:imidazoleglycerol-phosphate dehydratase
MIIMTTRRATIHRQTKETNVQIILGLDGTGEYEIETGIGFLDHMLAHVAVHGLFDLAAQASGDLHVDPHHTVEDVALTLGEAFDQALGDRAGIVRIGSATVPMDESLAFVAARANVHARVLYGRDDHHKAEALFKALGRALDTATRLDPRRGKIVPSTKGIL